MRSDTPTWDEVFLDMAGSIAEKSKDPSTQCGAVLVSPDNVVLAMGFNGPPSGLIDTEVPWEDRPQKYAYILHAEENALWFAIGGWGFDRVKGSRMYTTHEPCAECVLRMIRCKVSTVVLPQCTPIYPMSKYLVEPANLIAVQFYPKLEIKRV